MDTVGKSLTLVGHSYLQYDHTFRRCIDLEFSRSSYHIEHGHEDVLLYHMEEYPEAMCPRMIVATGKANG